MTFKALHPARDSAGRVHSYQAAGAIILSHTPLELLAPWFVGETADDTEPVPDQQPVVSWDHLLHRGDTWLGDRLSEVRCWSQGGFFLLETDELTGLILADHGRLLTYYGGSDVHRSLLEEMVVGPAFILSLAHQGTFTLHASAVVLKGQAHVFLGNSGAGKSTLAAFLGERAAAGCRRISDDILPMRLESGLPVALPHYPQLKLAAEEQNSSPQFERLSVAAVYLLDSSRRGDGRGRDGVSLCEVPPRDAALALVRHTVASRLFTAPLLARHLHFCTSLALKVPVHHLGYPLRRDVLPSVGEALGMVP